MASVGGSALAQERSDTPLDAAITVEPADDACLTATALVERVGQWLDRGTVDARLSVSVELGGEAGPAASFELRREGDSPAVRTFDRLPGECAARVDALALAIAIAIDPAVMERVAAAVAPGGEEGAEIADGEEAAGVDPVPSGTEGGEPEGGEGDGTERDGAEPPKPTRFAVALGGSFAWRVLPGLAATATLTFEVVLRERFVLRVGGLVSSQPEQALGPGAYESRLFGGRVDGCLQWPVAPFALGGCVGVLVGAFRAQGVGFEENLVTIRPWVAVAAGIRAAVPATSRVAFALTIEGVVPLLRPTVHVMDAEGETAVRSSVPSLGLQVALEALVRFP